MTTVLCIGGDTGILEIKNALREPRGYIVLTAPLKSGFLQLMIMFLSCKA